MPAIWATIESVYGRCGIDVPASRAGGQQRRGGLLQQSCWRTCCGSSDERNRADTDVIRAN